MKKTMRFKNHACLLAAVIMLSGCGQAKPADAPPADTTALETSAQEATKPETQTEVNTSLPESSKSEDKEEEETSANESSAIAETAADESSAAKEETTTSESRESSAQPETKETEKETKAPAETSPETTAANQEILGKSIKDIYGEITQSVSLNSPMVLPDEFISNYYGIDVSTLEEYVFSMSEASTSAETIVLMKAKDPSSTGALSASLETVISQKRSEMENYLPDQFQIVDKSSVQVKGNYVYLVISEQADSISRIIQAGIQ